MKAIIPVAGLGTRLLPASKAIPKEMLPVSDKPIIQWVIEEAANAGIKQIILVTRYGKEAIENHFDSNFEVEHELNRKGKTMLLDRVRSTLPENIDIISVRQSRPLGLGHAILCAQPIIQNDDAFAVLLPDTFILSQQSQQHDLTEMISCWNDSGRAQILVTPVEPYEVDQYGIIDCGDKKLSPGDSIPAKNLVEKPNINNSHYNLGMVGRYILPTTLFSNLTKTKAGKDNEIQLTDALASFLKEPKGSINAFCMRGAYYDCGHKLGYIKAQIAASINDDDGHFKQQITAFLANYLGRQPSLESEGNSEVEARPKNN